MVRKDKKAVILRYNAIIKELSNPNTDEKTKESLLKEFESLKTEVNDETRSEIKKTLIKTLGILSTMIGYAVLDRNFILNKAAFSFMPKHI